jgi:hypothetical protein
VSAVAASGFDTSTGWDPTKITMSENLVLGLLGGLHPDSATASQLDYDPSKVGAGPSSLYIGATGFPVLPKQYPPYLDNKQLSWSQSGLNGTTTGHFTDASGDAYDTIIPCFVDRFNDQMPILYLRAKVGASPAGTSNLINPIITNDLTETQNPPRPGQYDQSQYIAYTGAYTGTWPGLTLDGTSSPAGRSIGVGKSASKGKYTVAPGSGGEYHGLNVMGWSGTYPPTTPSMTSPYPYDAFPYLVGSSGQVREKDAYILISAGADRVYGTDDDLCNFGTVGQ